MKNLARWTTEQQMALCFTLSYLVVIAMLIFFVVADRIRAYKTKLKENMKKINLFRAKYSMLFFDALAWIVRIDTWQNLRKESNTIYKLLKVMYK